MLVALSFAQKKKWKDFMYRWINEIGWNNGKNSYDRQDKMSLQEWKEALKDLQHRLAYCQEARGIRKVQIQKEIEELKKKNQNKAIKRRISDLELHLKSMDNSEKHSEQKLETQIRMVKEKIRLFEGNKNPSHKGFRHKTKKRSNLYIHDEVVKIIHEENPDY